MTLYRVHNHGPEDGPGLACRERYIDGRVVGDCIRLGLRSAHEPAPPAAAPSEPKDRLREIAERLARDWSGPVDHDWDRCGEYPPTKTPCTCGAEERHIVATAEMAAAIRSELERVVRDSAAEAGVAHCRDRAGEECRAVLSHWGLSPREEADRDE